MAWNEPWRASPLVRFCFPCLGQAVHHPIPDTAPQWWAGATYVRHGATNPTSLVNTRSRAKSHMLQCRTMPYGSKQCPHWDSNPGRVGESHVS